MIVKSMRYALGLMIMFMTCLAWADENILIDNFERWWDDPQWTFEGRGFGASERGNSGITGYQSDRFMYSAGNGGNDSRGVITSQPFEIKRNYINFLIGGGGFEGQTCMNLIVDGEIVRTATGPNTKEGGTKALVWQGWDVRKLKGKKARIQVVDNREGLWGYIAVDYIYQSNDAMKPVRNGTRNFKLEKKYLNFPINHDSPVQVARLLIDDKIVREFRINLAEGKPEFWVYLEIDDFRGEKATLQIDQLNANNTKGLDSVFQADTFPGQEELYKEKLRPQFHFTTKRGWVNDTNGLVYYDGEYHLFYQHGPFGCAGAEHNQTWGHAVSKNLIHWTELGDAIYPDELGTIFSGSGVVDWKNTTGFGVGGKPPLVFIYTSAGGVNKWSKGKSYTQSIAYSNDRGRTFTKYEGNPVQEHIIGGNRDPKAIWFDKTQEWVILLELEETFGIFTSKDLKKWEMQSDLEDGAFHDCPELFELPVDGDENNTMWVIHDGTAKYFCGDFDGKKYTPQTELIKRNYGNCFYAAQAFNNVPKEDGRCIQMAWGLMGFEPIPGMPFNQQITFPVELTLRTTEEGPRLFTNPVREIELIHGRKQTWNNEKLDPGQNLLSDLKGEFYDIEAEFVIADAAEFGFVIFGVPVLYNVEEGKLLSNDLEAPLKPQDGKIKLRLLIDRLSIEVFANDGRVYMPIQALHMDKERGFEIFTRGGRTDIEELTVYELKSIWH
ncbi:MAG: glycoside hydrolase family 32 protein [Planctomycetota bacterium]